jgi:hypothetical protein
VNRASALRQRRYQILERYPCLGSRDPQEVVNCRHSEFGAEDAWLELSDIDEALSVLTIEQRYLDILRNMNPSERLTRAIDAAEAQL